LFDFFIFVFHFGFDVYLNLKMSESENELHINIAVATTAGALENEEHEKAFVALVKECQQAVANFLSEAESLYSDIDVDMSGENLIVQGLDGADTMYNWAANLTTDRKKQLEAIYKKHFEALQERITEFTEKNMGLLDENRRSVAAATGLSYNG